MAGWVEAEVEVLPLLSFTRSALTLSSLRTSIPLLHDRTCAVYDCMTEHCLDESKDVAYWLRQEKAKSRLITRELYQTKRAAFQRCMRAIHSAGVDFDPRNRHTAIPTPRHAARLARDAQTAWRNLRNLQRECESFDKILEGAAERKRRAWETQHRLVVEARFLHCAEMAACEARRRAALRLLLAGKTVLYGIVWTRGLSAVEST